jgi:hypothetical protein
MLGLRSFRFEYSVPPSKAAQALANILRRPEWNTIDAQVTAERVTLEIRTPWWFQNSFNPVFVGRFRASDRGAILTGRFRLHLLVIVFLLVFFGFSIYELIQTFLEPEHKEGYIAGWRSMRLNWSLEILGFGVLVLLLGWLVGYPNRQTVLHVIKQSI